MSATDGHPIRQILLIGHTHHDVGYTNSPRIIDDMHVGIVRRVIELAEADPEPGPSQFRWTFEVARPVLRFVRESPAGDVARLRRLLDAGRIAVTGGYLNMTQLMSDGEFGAAYDALSELRDAGIQVRTEQHGDVNGIAWGAVEDMRREGLDRLVMALNPDHGRAPLTQPTGFWWMGTAGAPVFVWLSTHYGVGEEWGIIDGDVDLAERRIAEFVATLDARPDYPYDTAVVHAANDNRWPTTLFLDVVRHWNARHPDRPMRTATVDDALDMLIPQARAADIPVLRGEWSDWWSHGHGSTAREVAVYREARTFARAAQTALGLAELRGDGHPALAQVLGYRRGPVRLRAAGEIRRDLGCVDESLLLYAEHTWGAWETFSKPYSTFNASHHNAKSGFAYAAYDQARDLAVEGMFRLAAGGDAPPGGGCIAVVNPSERSRTEPIDVEVDGRARARTIVTAPPFSVVSVPLPPAPAQPRTGSTIELGDYRAVVEPARGGVTSLVHLPTGRELVDPAFGWGLAAIVTESVAPGSTHPMLTEHPRFFHPDFPGPDLDRRCAAGSETPSIVDGDGWTRITWRTSPRDLPEATTSMTLYRGVDTIDVEVDLVKPATLTPESIHVVFPFLVDEPQFLLQTAGAVYQADAEQLPDTSKDWYSIQHAIAVNGTQHGVLWGTFDAPLVQLGALHTGEWARTLSVRGGLVSSWLMNNLHFTNFQASQDGTRRYRYRFAAGAQPWTRAQVRVFGRDLLEPLQARWMEQRPAVEGGTGLVVEPAESVLAEVRPAADGVRVRVRSIVDRPQSVLVDWTGESVEGGRRIALGGHETADVVLRRR